jgi:hypothetical protein
MIKDMFQAQIDIPCVSNLIGETDEFPEAMVAIQDKLDWQAYTLYSSGDADNYELKLGYLKDWIGRSGKSDTGFWFIETNYTDGSYVEDVTKFTVDYLNRAFRYGAALVCLHRANNGNYAFFDANGYPISAMKHIAGYISSLQQIGNLIT